MNGNGLPADVRRTVHRCPGSKLSTMCTSGFRAPRNRSVPEATDVPERARPTIHVAPFWRYSYSGVEEFINAAMKGIATKSKTTTMMFRVSGRFTAMCSMLESGTLRWTVLTGPRPLLTSRP